MDYAFPREAVSNPGNGKRNPTATACVCAQEIYFRSFSPTAALC